LREEGNSGGSAEPGCEKETGDFAQKEQRGKLENRMKKKTFIYLKGGGEGCRKEEGWFSDELGWGEQSSSLRASTRKTRLSLCSEGKKKGLRDF